jgi:GT2 family glycosyltransferase
VTTAAAQAHPSFEVVVVDDGSDEGAVESLRSAAGEKYRLVSQQHAGLNAARNRAIAESQADFIAFLDDDEEAAPDWLAGLDAAIRRNPGACCVGGPMIAPELPTPRTCERCSLRDGERDLGEPEREVDRVVGGNMAMPLWAFEKVGLFDERIPCCIGDDDEWMHRAEVLGLPIVHTPAARVLHIREPSDYTLPALARLRWKKSRQIAVYHHRLGVPAPESIRGGPRALAHGIRYRCWAGVLNAFSGAAVSFWATWLRVSPPSAA